VKRYMNVSGGLLEARDDGGSLRVDSKSPGADGKRNRANKIGCGELRKEPRERARGWGTSAGYGRLQGEIRGWSSKGCGHWEAIG